MGAPTLTDAEVESLVLGSADDLFYRRGLSNVSMAEIRDASGVSMRRLYNFAPSKSDLIARWLEYRHVTWTSGFVQRVDDHVALGANAIDAIFDALADWMTDTHFRGCAFINTHAESAELADEHRAIISDHKSQLVGYLDGLVGHGDGLGVLVDGAIVQAAIFSSTDPIRHARRAAQALTNGSQND